MPRIKYYDPNTGTWKYADGLFVAGGVLYTAQDLTEEQKAQARENIGAEECFAETSIVGTSIGEKCAEFSRLLRDTNEAESFIFFTDPHTAAAETGWESEFRQYINTLKAYYDATPTDLVLCGGDWLELHSRSEACFRLGYVDGIMRSTFGNYYAALGNHDHNANTSGVTYPEEDDVGVLPISTVRNFLLRNQKNTYYSFDGVNTKFYVLDSGTQWWNMTEHMWEQVAWLAEELKTNDSKNSAILVHAAYETSSEDDAALEMIPFMTNVLDLCHAYNKASTITLNGIDYDFSGCAGRMRFVLCGHKHRDYSEEVNGITIVQTANMRAGGVPTFELCLVDYDNNLLHLVRVGWGESRTFELSEGESFTNQIPISIDTDGNVYNGIGYKPNTRLGVGTGNEVAHDTYSATGYIPANPGDTVRIKGISNTGESALIYYTDDFAIVWAQYMNILTEDESGVMTFTAAADSGCKYMRFTGEFDENPIITVNEEIS